MKKLLLTKTRKNSLSILGLLFIANLLLIGLANSYFKSVDAQPTSNHAVQDKNIVESGWQVLNWGYSLLEYFRYETKN
ncbi:MAG: hypothetical protein H6608_02290 [Flavobacteriales bacterium]|nr:hypothetical protein [Flavobacteriales bacterium]